MDDWDRAYDQFRAGWRQVDDDRRAARRRRFGWLKRWTVCWWKHRVRRTAPGTFLSRSCWACTAGHSRA